MLTLAGGTTMLQPLAARAQKGPVRIGVLFAGGANSLGTKARISWRASPSRSRSSPVLTRSSSSRVRHVGFGSRADIVTCESDMMVGG